MFTYRWRPDQFLDENNCEEGDMPENTEAMRLENPALMTGKVK